MNNEQGLTILDFRSKGIDTNSNYMLKKDHKECLFRFYVKSLKNIKTILYIKGENHRSKIVNLCS